MIAQENGVHQWIRRARELADDVERHRASCEKVLDGDKAPLSIGDIHRCLVQVADLCELLSATRDYYLAAVRRETARLLPHYVQDVRVKDVRPVVSGRILSQAGKLVAYELEGCDPRPRPVASELADAGRVLVKLCRHAEQALPLLEGLARDHVSALNESMIMSVVTLPRAMEAASRFVCEEEADVQVDQTGRIQSTVLAKQEIYHCVADVLPEVIAGRRDLLAR